MSHTHAWVLVHVVFSTKERANLIPDVSELCRYITGIAQAKKVTLLAAGGTSNHVHLLIALNPSLALSKAVQDLKGNSSRWLGEHGVKFAWQEGYGAFGVSQSQKEVVADYIGPGGPGSILDDHDILGCPVQPSVGWAGIFTFVASGQEVS